MVWSNRYLLTLYFVNFDSNEKNSMLDEILLLNVAMLFPIIPMKTAIPNIIFGTIPFCTL